MNERIQLLGSVDLAVVRAGKIVHRYKGKNLVTTAGKSLYAELAAGSGTKPSHFGFGSGQTVATESETQLVSEYAYGGYARFAFATSRINNQLTYATTGNGWMNNSGGPLSLGEVGIFNAASGPTMSGRFLTTLYTLAANDYIRLSWVLSFEGRG